MVRVRFYPNPNPNPKIFMKGMILYKVFSIDDLWVFQIFLKQKFKMIFHLLFEINIVKILNSKNLTDKQF
jgi:hypothetical protein